MEGIIELLLFILAIYLLVKFWKAIVIVLLILLELYLAKKLLQYLIDKYRRGEKKSACTMAALLTITVISACLGFKLNSDMKNAPQVDKEIQNYSIIEIPGDIYIDNRKDIKKIFTTAELKKESQTINIFAYYRSGDGLHNRNVQYDFVQTPSILSYSSVRIEPDGKVTFKKNALKGKYILSLKYGDIEKRITFRVK